MDFLYCTENCSGPVTYTTDQCPGSPGDDCRVITWNLNNVPPGATGSVCFWVLVARLQTVEDPDYYREFFAYAPDSVRNRIFECLQPFSMEHFSGIKRE